MPACFRRLVGALVLICTLGAATAARAHPSPSSEVLLTVRANAIAAQVTLPVDELKLAFPGPLLDASGRWAQATDPQLAAYLAGHVRPVAPDGRAWSVKVERIEWRLDRKPADIVADVTLRPPPGAPLGTLVLNVDAIAHGVPNHATLVALRDPGRAGDARPHMLGALGYGRHSVAITGIEPRWWTGFGAMFRLGMEHIAEGTDHLLFLLTLLLPAALRVDDGRWGGFAGARHLARKLVTVVTAFTLGHSLTLALGATGMVVLPSQPVEVLIAVSILVSAVHAWRPIFPRREGWIAAGFGLVHGMAFASALADMQLSGARLAAGVLAFNLGIETVQAVLVLGAAPLLMALARGRYYGALRPGAALASGAMALVWIGQRIVA